MAKKFLKCLWLAYIVKRPPIRNLVHVVYFEYNGKSFVYLKIIAFNNWESIKA